MHDRKAFNDPQEFQPERYLKDGKLNPDVRDPDCAAFGFGRRSVNVHIQIPPTITTTSLISFLVYEILKRQLVILNCILSSRGI